MRTEACISIHQLCRIQDSIQCNRSCMSHLLCDVLSVIAWLHGRDPAVLNVTCVNILDARRSMFQVYSTDEACM